MGPLQACDIGRKFEDTHFTGKQRTGAEFGKAGGAVFPWRLGCGDVGVWEAMRL